VNDFSAEKKRFAKTTSSRSRKAGSRKAPGRIAACTFSVTAR